MIRSPAPRINNCQASGRDSAQDSRRQSGTRYLLFVAPWNESVIDVVGGGGGGVGLVLVPAIKILGDSGKEMSFGGFGKGTRNVTCSIDGSNVACVVLS